MDGGDVPAVQFGDVPKMLHVREMPPGVPAAVPERIFLDLKLIERDAQTETAELVEKHVE